MKLLDPAVQDNRDSEVPIKYQGSRVIRARAARPSHIRRHVIPTGDDSKVTLDGDDAKVTLDGDDSKVTLDAPDDAVVDSPSATESFFDTISQTGR